MRSFVVLFAALTIGLALGCSKDEKKDAPAAPDPAAGQAAAGQAAAGQVAAAPGTPAPNGAATPATPGTVVMQNGANKVVAHGNATEMKAGDGRKVTATGDKVVAEDPSRPGTKVEIQGNTVNVPGVGKVPIQK